VRRKAFQIAGFVAAIVQNYKGQNYKENYKGQALSKVT
jgi:hypothetical protein